MSKTFLLAGCPGLVWLKCTDREIIVVHNNCQHGYGFEAQKNLAEDTVPVPVRVMEDFTKGSPGEDHRPEQKGSVV